MTPPIGPKRTAAHCARDRCCRSLPSAREPLDLGAATPQESTQVKLTEKHIQGFMAAYDDIARLDYGADPEKRDPKVDAQAAAAAKKNGFASLAQYEDVLMNITMIMFGIDRRPRISPSRPNRSRMDRGTQFRQIPTGGGKERGRGATRGGAHDGKTHSIQGKHRAGAKVLRPAHTIHAGNGYDPATCGLEILLASFSYFRSEGPR